ncbi:MAG: YeeE/YedE thiosulfate transporter family protein [Pseudomonas sp.]|uniref:YeeE/YedE thiosulfate transporter family protein n=1 Tax=Pseudomonas abieticivorans TaxID=2931382 RepID=UPI0020C00907|nr:YeeE/YedE thiosulfate transporter family protein [Pseudomonas sp. PIA16]MDE1165442.1 YeeE/YedE thiosulfate transporter family protein [Pseudomonas sp.]
MVFSLLMALALAFLIGWVSQRMGMCLVKACEQLLTGRPTLFVALTSCGLFGLLMAPLYRFSEASLPLYSPGISYPLLVSGGLLFGVASVLNNGCSVGTLTRFACGNFNKLFTMIGWVLGIVFWYYLHMMPEQKTILMPEITSRHYWLLIGVVALVLIFLVGIHGNKHLVFSSMLLGALTSALYTFEPLWTPSVFFYNVSQMFWQADMAISARRIAVFVMLLAGMLSFTLYRKTFRFEAFTPSKAGVHLLAGILMGIGASMMLGGNDSQILLVFPTLGIASSLPLVSIATGILVSLWCKKRVTR